MKKAAQGFGHPARNRVAVVLSFILLGTGASTLAQDAPPSLVPDTITSNGVDLDAIPGAARVYPDGRLYLELWTGPDRKKIRTPVPIPPEMVQQHYLRLVVIPLEEQKKILTDIEKNIVDRDVYLDTNVGRRGITGPYRAIRPDVRARQLTTAYDYCKYTGPNRQLREQIRKDTLGIWAFGWVNGCKKGQDVSDNCGIGRHYLDQLVYAIGVVKRPFVYTKYGDKDLFPAAFTPIPKKEWKYLKQCVGPGYMSIPGYWEPDSYD